MPVVNTFEAVASAFTVKSIQEEFCDFIRSDESVADYYATLWEDQVYLVVRGDKAVGWTRGYELWNKIEQGDPLLHAEMKRRGT